MEKEAAGIRFQTRDEEPRMENLMHHVNEQTLMEEHRKQSRRKATGIDGVTKDEYNVNVEKNLKELVERMKRFSYRPMPVRRTYIPKANGKKRPLGIPAYEDKLVQGVMARLLNEVYEVRFLDCSYGFQNFKQIQKFWKYLKYETYRMLNRRDQKGKLRYPKFLRIWNFYIEEPKLKVYIWGWKPKNV